MVTNYSTPPLDPRPPLPIPDIPLLLERFGNAAEPFVSAELLSSYRDATSTLFTQEATQKILNSLNEKQTNWSNTWFIKLLLSTRWQVPTSTRLSTLVNVPETTRERKLATLLRAVGVWSREYVFSNGSRYTAAQKRLEWQLRGLCGTFRVPISPNTCTLEYTGPGEARHAVAWWRGSAWKVIVVDEDGVVFSVDAIEQQIQEILKSRPEQKTEPSIASLSWRLNRRDWHHEKTAYNQIPENTTSMSTLYSSLVTIALEEYSAPTNISDHVNDVRMGGTSENRFADQTFGVVSYSDGKIGLAFDHAPSDCGPAMELSIILLEIINSTSSFPSSRFTAPSITEQIKFTPPKHLSILNLPESVVEAVPRTVITTNIPPKIPGTPRLHVSSRLCDTVANLALQSALLRTSGKIPPMFQPVILRNFYLGRCDSMIPVTPESLAFIRLAFPSQPQDEKEHIEELYNSLAATCKKRKEIIIRTQDGLTTKYFSQGYLYPELERIAKETPLESQTAGFKAALGVFRKVSGHTSEEGDPTASVQFTGFTTPTDDIYAGLSNIYLPNVIDQLVVFYLQKPSGTLTVSFSGTGTYRDELEGIVRSYKESYEVISGIADEYVKHLANVAPPPALS